MDPSTMQAAVPMSVGESEAWFLTVVASLLGGAASYKKWGPPPAAPTNGRLEAIPRLVTVVESFVATVGVQHAVHADTLSRQTALMERMAEILVVLRERSEHPAVGPQGPPGPTGPAGPPGPVGATGAVADGR